MKKYYVDNVNAKVAAFEAVGKIVVINNSLDALDTHLYVEGNLREKLRLAPMEMRWLDI